MKTKVLFFLFIIVIVLNSFGQESVRLKGIVKNDSILLKDINIINKTKNTGTSSDRKGHFFINASAGDSIVFSSINFSKRIIVASNKHIKTKSIIVYLEEEFNELDEITLNQSLKFDVGNIYIHKNMAIDMEEDVITNRPPDIRKQVNPLGNSSNGISILGLAFKIADELFLKKIRLKIKQEKKKEIKQHEEQLEFVNNIVPKYGESFFINELNINEDEIYQFIDYCEDHGIVEYYNSNEFIIKNFIIEHAIKFNNIKP